MMSDMEYLKQKRKEVLEAIKPICEAFKINEYDYIVKPIGQKETLIINGQEIGCSMNSISSTIEELIGYIFVYMYARNRSLGAFRTQTLNIIKQYWR